MTIYARIDGDLVMELISPKLDEEGVEFPIGLLYHPDFVATLVDVTGVSPTPEIYDVAKKGEDGWTFEPGGL